MALAGSIYSSLTIIAVSVAVFLVGIAIGKALGWAVRNLLEKVGMNEWIERFAVGKAIAKAGYKPSEFFGKVTAWIIYASATIIALYSTTSLMGLVEATLILRSILVVYIGGFVKAFIVIIIGFLLVDAFIGYLYKTEESAGELEFLRPVAEYLRILLYIITVVFALDQGGIEVSFLGSMLTPILWGITVIMVIVILSRSVEKHIKPSSN